MTPTENTDEIHEILSMPVLTFPYYFANGSYLESIDEMICTECGTRIPDSDVRGTFAENGHGTVILDGYAICSQCMQIYPIGGRFHSDGTALVNSSGSWSESRWAPLPRHGISKWIDLLIKTFGKRHDQDIK